MAHFIVMTKLVLLRCTSGLAQSLRSYVTPISLTAGVASLLIGFTCFSFYRAGARATVDVGDMVYALLHRSGI